MSGGPWQRRRARRALVQAVYQWQLGGADVASVAGEFRASGALDKADEAFFDELLKGVLLGTPALDERLAPLLDRRLEDLDQVERAVLRLGTFELAHRPDVPYRVVIDEYVELAKVFGAEESFRYINGVLDRLAAELRAVEHGAARGS